MDVQFFMGALCALTLFYVIIGFVVSRSMKTSSDYFLAGRNLGIGTITATLLATQIGGGYFLGTAQDPCRGLLYAIGMTFGLLVLGLGIAQKLRAFNVSTVGEILEVKYGSPFLHHLASSLAIMSMCGILISQIHAAQGLITHFTGTYHFYGFLLFWLLIIFYTMIGGLKGVAYTDVIQVSSIIIIFSGIFIYQLLYDTASVWSPQVWQTARNVWHNTGPTSLSATRIIAVPMLFSLIEQDLAQRFFAARSKRIAGIAALCASIILIAFAYIPFSLGLQATIHNYVVPKGISPLIPVLKHMTSNGVFLLATYALLAAVTSTSDSLLCAISSLATTSLCSITGAKKSIFLSRLITSVFGIGTLVAAYVMPKQIIAGLVSSYELSVACLFVPIFMCFVTKKHSYLGAVCAMLAGGLAYGIFLFIQSSSISQWATFITLGMSLFGYYLGTFLSKNK